jgi:N utilization substance protein B
MLYQLDLAQDLGREPFDPEAVRTAMGRYWQSFDAVGPEDEAFAERLVMGVARELKEMDAALAEVSHHWKVARMGRVDRNVLRLAAYEMLRCPDIPRAASINEAIEIAKRFSNNEAAAFINGILDQLARNKGAGEAKRDDSTEGG